MDEFEEHLLSEISQAEKDKTVCFHLYQDLKKNKINEYNKAETDS